MNQLQLLVAMDPSEPHFGDIALAPDGNLYRIAPFGEIHLIDLETGTSEQVGNFPEGAYTALVIDELSICYSIDWEFHLRSYNLTTGIDENIMYLGEWTPGDITFYNGYLVFPSSEGVIKAINIESNTVDTIFCIPEEVIDLMSIWGIYNEFTTCGEEKLVISNTANQLWRFDVENNEYEQIPYVYNTNEGGIIHGMTSSDDILSAGCQGIPQAIEGGCEEDEEPTNTVEFEPKLNETLFYPNPATDKIIFSSSSKIKQIEIYSASGNLVYSKKNPSRELDLSFLSDGFYMVSCLFDGNRIMVERLVVVN